MNITIISVGTLKEKYLSDAVSEYQKRLSQYARVEQINIKEEKIKDEDDKSEVRRALELEGEKILAAVPRDSVKVALCVEGREYDSISLARLIERYGDGVGKLTFIIGSSHGLSDAVKSASDEKLSVSALTFPHQLMRVILMEALYRSMTIIAGKRYHK